MERLPEGCFFVCFLFRADQAALFTPSFAAIAARPPLLHPVVDLLRIIDDLGDRAVEAEKAVGQAEAVQGLGERAHAAHEIGAAAADDDVERRGTAGAEMLAQRVAHGAEGLVDVGVVRLAADDEQHVGLREPVLVADARDLLHLLVGRVAAEVRGDDRGIAEHLGDQRIGAAAEGRREDRALVVDDENVRLALMGAQLVDLLLELGGVGGEQMVGEPEPLPARIVAVESAFEVAGDGGEAAVLARPHADRVELEGRHAVVVHQLPQLGQVLHQRRDHLLRRADVGERVRDHEGLEPGERLERHIGDEFLVELLDLHAAHVGERHRRGAEFGGVVDREVDLVLGRHARLEGHAVRLGAGIAVAMLDEIKPLLLLQCGLEIARLADQPGLALLADAALEHRLDEDQLVAIDQPLDLVFRCGWAEHFGGGKIDMLEELRAVEHSGDLHDGLTM